MIARLLKLSALLPLLALTSCYVDPGYGAYSAYPGGYYAPGPAYGYGPAYAWNSGVAVDINNGWGHGGYYGGEGYRGGGWGGGGYHGGGWGGGGGWHR